MLKRLERKRCNKGVSDEKGGISQRFYRVKVGNAIRVIGKGCIVLGAKSEKFDRILREEVYAQEIDVRK